MVEVVSNVALTPGFRYEPLAFGRMSLMPWIHR